MNDKSSYFLDECGYFHHGDVVPYPAASHENNVLATHCAGHTNFLEAGEIPAS